MRDALKAARDALDRTTTNFRLLLGSKPVRDVSETLAEADHAIAQADAALAVVADERAAFEAAMRALHPVECKAGVLGRVTNTASARFDMYGMFDVQLAWELWQARARLGSHADVEDAARAILPPQTNIPTDMAEVLARDGFAMYESDQPAPEPAEPRVPAGWKLVPVDLPDAMRDAGLDGMMSCGATWTSMLHGAYRAMLAAAPAAPHAKPLTEERIVMDGLMMLPNDDAADCAKAFAAGVRYAERAHGIKAPE